MNRSKSIKILNEGGNVEIGGIAAQRLDLNKISRSQAVKVIDKALQVINAAFNKMYKVPLWSPELIKNKEFLSGSAFHFFNVTIPDEQFVKVKPSVGDIDTMVDKKLAEQAKAFLTQATGKKFGPATLIGFKPNPGQDTLITLWEFAEPAMKVQVDMELVDYAKGSPSEWSKFSHSSSWEDLSVGVKGVFHKYLLRSLTHKDAKDRYIQMKTKLKKVNAADMAFAVTGGVRQKFEPVIDPATKKPAVAQDGLGIYKEIPASEAQYFNKIKDMFTLLMGRKPAKGEEQKLGSFVGVLDLINNNFSPDEKLKIANAFFALLFGPAAQQLYKGDPASDKKEKEIALNKLIQTLAVNLDKGQLAKGIADYYSNYAAESLTEADGPDYSRQGIKHIYNPGSTVEMKDVDFLAFVDAIAKNGGTLDNIPITLKVDGAGIRFGKDQAGKPFFMTSRVTTPIYAKQVGMFAKYSQDNNGTPDQVARAEKYDQALSLIVNSDFIKELPKDTIVQAEMLFNAMAEKTDKGLKFVNIPYDPKKLGKQMTLVPITVRKFSDGSALPQADSVIQKLTAKSGKDIKIVGTDLQHSDIDVSNIVAPIAKMDSQLRAALTSKKKNDPNKAKAKEILSQARQALSNAIINSPNIKGQDKLGDTNEGLVIAMPNGQLAKVTSVTMKDAMAAKKAAPRTGGNRTKAAVVTAGSFVGHIGHQAVVNSVIAAAKKLGGDPYVYISAKTGPDDPIPPEVKLATWKKLYPEYSSMFQLITSPDGTVPNPMKKIEKELVLPATSPYKKIVLMVGTDRYEGFKKWMDTLEKRMKDPAALAKYGGTQDQVSYDVIAIPRGAALGGIDASFTQLRNVLKDPKLSLKQKLEIWSQGFGGKLDADWIKKLMMLAAQGMGIKLNEVQLAEKTDQKKDKYATNITFPDGRVYISGHLLERIALRTLSQKDMLDIIYIAKTKFGNQIANLPNVDFVIKRKDGLGYGIKKILMPDDTFKYVIATAHDKKNVGKFQTRYVIDEDDDLNVKFHDKLNSAIFTSEGRMSPVVKKKLLDIAEDFKASLGVTSFNLKDITVSGSNAAYNYTPHSDIDLHLVVDLPQADHDAIYRELFDAKKFQYNEQHDYKIKGYDVELYVQNANDEHISQGIYSLMHDNWIKQPEKIEASYDEESTREKYNTLKHLILKAIKAKDYHLGDKLRKTIKKYRQIGLHSTGEFGPENLAFKALRSNGYIEKLYSSLNDLKDQEFSLESHDQRLTEIDMSPGSLTKFSASPAAQSTMVGFEAEMIVPNMKSEYGGEDEPDMDYDDYVTTSTTSQMRHDIISFFSETASEREIDRAVSEVDEEIMAYIDEAFREYLLDNRAEIIEKYKQESELSDEEIENSIDEQDSTYDELVDQLRDDFMNNWDDLDGALQYLDLQMYSGWNDRFGFGWPYYTSSEEGGDIDEGSFGEVAKDIKSVVGMPLQASPRYHAFSTREAGTWYLETDSSINTSDDEGGLELISPPMPLPQAMEKLAAVFDWMDHNGARTDSSTGFHMGVSIPQMENVDYIKLVLFLGDKYVLEQFGRNANTYTRSILGKMESYKASEVVRQIPALFQILSRGLDKVAMKMLEGMLVPKGEKYTSVNIKDKYIEFRSAGGNYVEQFEKIKNTMMRYVRVINLAADPNEAKEEYAKKLFKLLSPAASQQRGWDSVKFFTMYSTGNLNKQELISSLKDRERARKGQKVAAVAMQPNASKSWLVYNNVGNIVTAVYATNMEEAKRKAMEWGERNNQIVSRVQLHEPDEPEESVRPTSLAGYVAEADRPFVWQKEEPKEDLTEMQKACILGGHEYTGELE